MNGINKTTGSPNINLGIAFLLLQLVVYFPIVYIYRENYSLLLLPIAFYIFFYFKQLFRGKKIEISIAFIELGIGAGLFAYGIINWINFALDFSLLIEKNISWYLGVFSIILSGLSSIVRNSQKYNDAVGLYVRNTIKVYFPNYNPFSEKFTRLQKRETLTSTENTILANLISFNRFLIIYGLGLIIVINIFILILLVMYKAHGPLMGVVLLPILSIIITTILINHSSDFRKDYKSGEAIIIRGIITDKYMKILQGGPESILCITIEDHEYHTSEYIFDNYEKGDELIVRILPKSLKILQIDKVSQLRLVQPILTCIEDQKIIRDQNRIQTNRIIVSKIGNIILWVMILLSIGIIIHAIRNYTELVIPSETKLIEVNGKTHNVKIVKNNHNEKTMFDIEYNNLSFIYPSNYPEYENVKKVIIGHHDVKILIKEDRNRVSKRPITIYQFISGSNISVSYNSISKILEQDKKSLLSHLNLFILILFLSVSGLLYQSEYIKSLYKKMLKRNIENTK